DELICSICHEEFNLSSRRPKILPCGLCYCLQCLSQYFSSHKCSCEICNKPPHNSKSVEDLPPNIVIERVMNSLKENTLEDFSSNTAKKINNDGAVLDSKHVENNLNLSQDEFKSSSKDKILGELKNSRTDSFKYDNTEISPKHLEEKTQDTSCQSGLELKSSSKDNISGDFTSSTTDLLKDDNAGICPKHAGKLLHFSCKTHDELACNDCMRFVHIPNRCSVQTYQEYINQKKKDKIMDATESSATFTKALQNLEHVAKQKNKDILKIQSKINALQELLSKETLDVEEVNMIVEKGKTKHVNLINLRKELIDPNSKSDVRQVIEDVEFLTKELTNLKNKMEEDFTLEPDLTENPEIFKKRLKKWPYPIYVQKIISENIIRRTKIIKINENMLLPSLNEKMDTPANTCFLPLTPLMDTLQLHKNIFMEISAGGETLGKLYIELHPWSPNRSRQMISLCLNDTGKSWKCAALEQIYYKGTPGEYVTCTNYLTEEGKRVSKNLSTNLEYEYGGLYKEGNVTAISGSQAGFSICTIDYPNTRNNTIYIGRVSSGLEYLQQAIKKYDIKQIMISEVGVVI
ncbi:unnamed protein product, partial [Meganyctiphanes norvegica]